MARRDVFWRSQARGNGALSGVIAGESVMRG